MRADERVRVQVLAEIVMGAGCRKNHDKQLTHIVRVIVSDFTFFVFDHSPVNLLTIMDLSICKLF